MSMPPDSLDPVLAARKAPEHTLGRFGVQRGVPG